MQELAVLASSALAVQRQFTMTADNIANANTDGFKKMTLQFKENVSRPEGHPTASYVEDRGLVLDYTQGDLRRSGNPFDVAVTGNNFMAVQNANGETVYTKRGSFVMDAQGTLMLPTGEIVLDNAGAPIQVPPGSRTFTVAKDGSISTETGQIATLGVFNFSDADSKMMRRMGDATYLPTQGAAAVTEFPNVLQGFVETSNVNAVEEMTNMQMVSAAYQRSLTTMKGIEDLEQRAIRTLGGTQ